MEPSEQERATECVTPAEVIAKINAVSRQPVGEATPHQLRGRVGPSQHPLRKAWYPTVPRPWNPDNSGSAEKLDSRSLRESRCACANPESVSSPHFPETLEPWRDSSKRRSQVERLCKAKIALPDQASIYWPCKLCWVRSTTLEALRDRLPRHL